MKVRLNKKTKEELSTIPVLGTLQTKQKQVNEDITAYIDEPFLKPENIRHGITIAGVDGNYLDEIKYINIYDREGNHLHTLASTELAPEIRSENGNIVLTNKPFEDQYAFGYGQDNCIIRHSAGSSGLKLIAPGETTTLESHAVLYCNVPENPILTELINNSDNYISNAVLEASYGGISATYDGTTQYISGSGLEKYDCGSKYSYFNVLNVYFTSLFGNDDDTLIDGVNVKSVAIMDVENVRPVAYQVIVSFDKQVFNLSRAAYSLQITTRSDGKTRQVCCKPSNKNADVRLDAEDGITDVQINGNVIRFRIPADGEAEFTIAANGAISLTAAQALNTIWQEPDIQEATVIPPYYVELPTDLVDTYTPDEEVSIGETSRMLIYKGGGEMLLGHYMGELEARAPGIIKVSDTRFDTSRVVVYETLSQRIVLQSLVYDYLSLGPEYMQAEKYEVRVIEDSRTGEFNKLAFSNIGYGSASTYNGVNFDNSAFIMLYDNEGSTTTAIDGTMRYPGGMGFVFRLADGSFFVIDGGMGGNNEYYSEWKSQTETLLSALRAYASDPNHIRIAGWLLTHLHQDHVGVFDEVVNNHLNTVSIDKVIYSLPAEGFSGFDKPAAYSIWDDFEEALNTLRAAGKTEIIKAHMGMEFNFCNLGLTILSAPENVYGSYDPVDKKTIADITNINDSCVVCKVNYCSKELLFLADASKVQLNATIIPLLIQYIENNINAIQVPHHGYHDTNANVLYNQLVNSGTISHIEFTLWPVCYEHFCGKNLDGSVYQEEPGVNYTGVYEQSHNAAIKNITAIYPENNYSMVATPSTIGEWTFTAVDFVDPCLHYNSAGQSKAFANNDGTHTWKDYCNDCQSWAIYQYTTECSYDADGYCTYCGAMSPTTCAYCSNLASPSNTCCACNKIICSSHVSSYEGGFMCKACYGEPEEDYHDYCAHCGAGISGAEYNECTICHNIICNSCGADCPLCSEHACGGNITTYICYDCGEWSETVCSHQARPTKCGNSTCQSTNIGSN